ncbi:hypothetical protein LTR53_006299 [Teratosphaeriaceae sp. CCFEE 6253]|nr:hypothetical protein LTR53_006299 [Teratosphaeriaceae sp. CCFEE 6253]
MDEHTAQDHAAKAEGDQGQLAATKKNTARTKARPLKLKAPLKLAKCAICGPGLDHGQQPGHPVAEVQDSKSTVLKAAPDASVPDGSPAGGLAEVSRGARAERSDYAGADLIGSGDASPEDTSDVALHRTAGPASVQELRPVLSTELSIRTTPPGSSSPAAAPPISTEGGNDEALPLITTMPKKRPWTYEEVLELRRLRADCCSARSIAIRLRRSKSSVGHALNRFMNSIPTPSTVRPTRLGQAWTIEEIDELARLKTEGIVASEIAARLQRSEGSVREAAMRCGLQQKPPCKPFNKRDLEDIRELRTQARYALPRRFKPPPFTQQDIEILRALRDKGDTWETIGAHLQQSPSRVRRAWTYYGQTRKIASSHWTAEDLQIVRELRTDGVTWADVGDRMLRTVNSVLQAARRYGLVPHEELLEVEHGAPQVAPQAEGHGTGPIKNQDESLDDSDHAALRAPVGESTTKAGPESMFRLGLQPTLPRLDAGLPRSVGGEVEALHSKLSTQPESVSYRRGRRWSDSDLRELHRLRAEGQTMKQIAPVLHRTPLAVLEATHEYPTLASIGRQRRPWTAQDTSELIRMRGEGLTKKDIAGRLQVTLGAVRRAIVAENLPSRIPDPRYTSQELQTLYRLRTSGLTYKAIAARLQRSAGALCRAAKSMGVKETVVRRPFTPADLRKLRELREKGHTWVYIGAQLQRWPSSVSRRAMRLEASDRG